MRWVDIDKLEIPDGWQARADIALNDLREEIHKAEQDAMSNGGDVFAARKKVISEELDKQSRAKLWRELAPKLAELHNGKCWYSESLNPGSNKDVDHFRPKKRVAEYPRHEGYWWLAFDWHNYRYSCQWCNQRRNNSTDGGKWDHFPISGLFRAMQESDRLEMEEVDLLDPVDPDDWKLLTFRPDGMPTPSSSIGTREYERAAISIRIYHLDYKEFVDARRTLAGKVQRLVQDMEILFPKITDLSMRCLYKNQQKELLRFISRSSEYSSAALAYAKAEVYKIERGHQVKRLWLEQILNSNS